MKHKSIGFYRDKQDILVDFSFEEVSSDGACYFGNNRA